MMWILGGIVLILIFLVLCYLLAPAILYDATIWVARFHAGLTLKYCRVDGHRIPYLVGGEGPPLVLLHGFGADKDHWTMMGKYLTPHFRVYALDLPGFGDSDRILTESYGREVQVDRLKLFLEELGLNDVYLGGNSMGGYLAFMFANKYPDAILKLWLVAPAGALSAKPSEFMLALEDGLNSLIVETEAQLTELARLCFYKPPYVPSQFKRVLLKRSARNAEFNRKIFDENFESPLGVEDVSQKLSTDTLIVWGDADKILDCSGIEVFKQMLDRPQAILMEDVGHLPMLEKPQQVANNFLIFCGMSNE